ncbi:hypothetical protein EON65_10360 [archaeon]|nr:MAG: hypothetical protein EON65_10360 [archaeon]
MFACINTHISVGIFGAIQHIDQAMFKKSEKSSKPEIAFGNVNVDEDEDRPPKWKDKRKVLESTLEEELVTKPFESYKLMRGQANGLLGSTLKCVGYVKGIVRVVEDKEHLDKFPLLDQKRMDELLKPKKYVIRLYALNAVSLAAKDVDIFGNPSNSDPYIKVCYR